MRPKVSIVMPSLNTADYIEECISSVVNQTLKNIEIICVDAGSTDGTVEIIENFAKKDNRIKLINSDKKSYGYQMNLGIKAATGEYLGIVETDDYVCPDMYEKLTKIADKNKLDILKADYYIFVDNKGKRHLTYYTIAPQKNMYNIVLDPEIETAVFGVDLHTWCGIYNLDFLKEHNVYHNETPGASFQDNGFWFMSFANAHRVMFLPKPMYRLRRDNPNSSVFSKDKVFCHCDEYDFIRERLNEKPRFVDEFAPILAYYRFKAYLRSYKRVSAENKPIFLERASKDLKKAYEAGEFNPEMFFKSEWEKLLLIMDAPETFHKRQSLKNDDYRVDHWKLRLLYRINHMVDYVENLIYMRGFPFIGHSIVDKLDIRRK